MKWRNVRLAGKFGIGFGAVLLLLTFVGVWAIFGIGQIVGDAGEVIEGNKLRGEMVQREVDHLKWASAVNALLTDASVTELKVQTDPRQCGFGKWYYGEGRKHAEHLVPDLQPVLAELEEPHTLLHASAVQIDEIFRQADLGLPTFLAEKETDHYRWVNSVLDLFAMNLEHLTVQTDDQLCGLGKFLHGERGRQAAALDPELGRLLEAAKGPHERLH